MRVKWFLYEDKNGVIHNETLMNPRAPIRKGDITDVKLLLYTRSNPDEYELLDPINLNDIVSSKYFKSSRPSVFIIHGWNNEWSSPINQIILTAMLETQDVNVFVVHWGEIANKFYTTAKAAIPGIGMDLGFYIDDMMNHFKLSPKDVMLIGHSLGAHVAGAAGAAMMHKPHLIVGLDPAGPLFSLKKPELRLDETDAEHVHVIHTCGGFLSFKSSLGHSDFFPNGGSRQPGCGLDIIGTCAHSRSYKYYAESLRHCAFKAVACSSYHDFEDGMCDNNPASLLGCFKVDKVANGDFFLTTNDDEPFVVTSQ